MSKRDSSPRRSPMTRRQFLYYSALATASAATLPALAKGGARVLGAGDKLRLACVGANGKGRSDIQDCSGEEIVAICDVDQHRAADALQKFPNAKFYYDWREMLEKEEKNIDAVTVSTPDHLHACVASAAMKLGKHVYCQKPLTQTVYEARYLRKLAHDRKLVTQMGNQGSAADGLRRGVETIQDGLIGQVHEVHVWTNRPVWPQAMDRPAGEDPVPATLDWDVWIGAAPMRPYKGSEKPEEKDGVYHPFNWRGWQDFGCGALGDMACHTVNLPFRALDLDDPTEVEATPFGQMNKESYPVGSKIRFAFPKREGHVPVEHPHLFHRYRKVEHDATTLWWYDGGQPDANAKGGHDLSNKPPAELTADIVALRGDVPESGCLIIGDGGSVFSPDDYGTSFFVKLKGEEKFVHYLKHPAMAQYPERIPRNPYNKKGGGGNVSAHAQEWLVAIKENKPEMCYSRFDIAARLTEIMLLGCVSLRAGQKIEWDGRKMVAKNCPQAAQFIRRQDRSGWALA